MKTLLMLTMTIFTMNSFATGMIQEANCAGEVIEQDGTKINIKMSLHVNPMTWCEESFEDNRGVIVITDSEANHPLGEMMVILATTQEVGHTNVYTSNENGTLLSVALDYQSQSAVLKVEDKEYPEGNINSKISCSIPQISMDC